MKEITKILPLNEAAKLQTEAGNYDCRITDLAVVGGGNARISVAGTDENLKTLFDNVKIPLDNENKKKHNRLASKSNTTPANVQFTGVW